MILKPILQKLIDLSPDNYAEVINQATLDELKEVYIAFKQQYTDEDVGLHLDFYTSEELKEKLLGSSFTVLATLKNVNSSK